MNVEKCAQTVRIAGCAHETILLISASAALNAVTGVSILPSNNNPKKKPAAPAAPQGGRDGRDTGAALRSVYQRTVEEAIPAEMLDLLNKLA